MPELSVEEKEEQERVAAEHAAAEAMRTGEVVETEDDPEGDAAFDSGFEGKSTPEADKVPPKVDETVEAKPKVEPKVETPVPQTPTLTKEQIDQVLAIATSLPELKQKMEQQFGTAFGKLGGFERSLKQFQDQAAKTGEPVKVTKDDLKELIEEYPDLSDKLVPVLGRILDRVKIPTASAPVNFDPAEVTKVVDERVTASRRAQAMEDLAELHPDWREIVGAPGGKTAGQETAWRTWLKSQPAEYQDRVNKSWNPMVVASSIDKFNASTERAKKAAEEAAKQKPQTRSQRLAEAVPAKKPSAAQETTKSDDEEFDDGFKNGRK